MRVILCLIIGIFFVQSAYSFDCPKDKLFKQEREQDNLICYYASNNAILVEWYYVSSDETLGESLWISVENEHEKPKKNDNLLVCNFKHKDSFLSIRQQPNANSKELQKLYFADEVIYTGKSNKNWLQIKTAKGNLGWAHKNYLCILVAG